jgi:hypothetical protein
LVRACARWRKVVETVGSQLTEHFAVARIRVRDLSRLGGLWRQKEKEERMGYIGRT